MTNEWKNEAWKKIYRKWKSRMQRARRKEKEGKPLKPYDHDVLTYGIKSCANREYKELIEQTLDLMKMEKIKRDLQPEPKQDVLHSDFRLYHNLRKEPVREEYKFINVEGQPVPVLVQSNKPKPEKPNEAWVNLIINVEDSNILKAKKGHKNQ